MSIVRWLAGILVAALLGHYLLAMAVPHLVMELLYERGGATFGYNRLVVAPAADAGTRTVVRPSPDLFYAICIYNLEQGPLRIEAPVPARYWSMQFYRMNTDNFAGLTNQRGEKHRIGSTTSLTLIGPRHKPGDYGGELVRSPSERGVMLLRASAIGDRERQHRALELSRCEPA
jgi:uncharacterized membrane protein